MGMWVGCTRSIYSCPFSAYKTSPSFSLFILRMSPKLKTAMNPRMKCCVLLFLLLNAGTIECSGTFPSPHKAGVHARSRKLLEFSTVLDYDYAGPNPKHEPRGKKGGGGSKNP